MNKHLSEHQLLSYLEEDADAQHRADAQHGLDALHRADAPHRYTSHGASPRELERVEAHLRTCSTCRAHLERLVRTAADLGGTLQAVGEQVPLSPARSWEGVAQRRRGGRPKPTALTLAPFVRHAATLAVLVLIVAGLAGLIHTLAVTGPGLTRATPTPTLSPPASPSPPPGPLPRPVTDARAASVALLVLGTDGEAATSDEAATPPPADALMLLYLDRGTQRAFLLSLPRDLYVDVPGHGQARLGSVYGLGAADEGARGLVLARETVSATLDLPVQHAALVRFESFVALIDAVGGVDVEVPYPIEDSAFPDDQGGRDPLSMPAGLQHLEGEQALRYARTRAVPAPGFDRAFRQRQLVLAIHERVTRLDLLPGLIAQAPALWATISGGLETDLSLSDMIDLALLATDLAAEDIASAAFDECCTLQRVTSAGERVLLPQADEIGALIDELLEGE